MNETHDRAQAPVDVRTSQTPLELCTHTPLLNQGDPEAKRQEILAYFHNTYTLHESLYECLNSENAFFQKANRLRHPLIFYYGHTAVFFINKLMAQRLINKRIDPTVESTLAIGVDEMSWDDLNDAHYNWPSVSAVRAYRLAVRERVDRFIRDADMSQPIDWSHPLWVILMGIEHERIHLETSSVLIRELPLDQVRKHPTWGRICSTSGEAPTNALIPVEGGQVTLGRSMEKGRRGPHVYGWDNEFGRFDVEVVPFKASRYLVSNREFLAFVEDGGYERQSYWTEEGWGWMKFSKARCPVFWRPRPQGGYGYRTMLEEIDLPWDWPVEVNQLEAKAFCNWRTESTGQETRLPSEAEWTQMRELLDADQATWSKAPGNLNLEGDCSPCPVTRHACAGGFYDLVGNVWQWTETPIYPYPGFKTHDAYDDFSVPTFDAKHTLFKGGCWISTGNYALRDSRYAFRRHFFQHAGLRYVEAGPPPAEEVAIAALGSEGNHASNCYDTSEMIGRYLDLHYGQPHFDVPVFPLTCARICIQAMAGRRKERALDLGCASGRATFELATAFDYVDGVDFSARIIEAPTALKAGETVWYPIKREGDRYDDRKIQIDQLGYSSIKDKLHFSQGDACNLGPQYKAYDLVLACNLIDRLYDPSAFLGLIKDRIRPGGLLVLVSPYYWDEEFTPKAAWLGGFKDGGKWRESIDTIASLLKPEFSQHGPTQDVEYAIQETGRRFIHGSSQLSIWEKLS